MGQQQVKQISDIVELECKFDVEKRANIKSLLQTISSSGFEYPEVIESLKKSQLFQECQKPPSIEKQKGTALEDGMNSNMVDTATSKLMDAEIEVCQRVVEVMASKKLYHIRQSFRKLILSVLGLQNLTFYLFLDSGRIEFHDFKANYITQILESTDSHKTIQKMLAYGSQTVQKVNEGDKQFWKLFNMTQTEAGLQKIGEINKSNEKYSILVAYTWKEQNSCSVTNDLLQKIIRITMIETEESEYDVSKFYCKELLDILGLVISISEQSLKEQLQAHCPVNKPGLTVKEIVNQIDKEQNAKELLSESFLRYEEFRFELLQRVRMYEKYICEEGVIFLDFDEAGNLSFLANSLEGNPISARLSQLSKQNQLCIEKVFSDSCRLQMHIKKALKGILKNKKLYEVDNGVRVRITQNEEKQILRISIIVEEPIESQSSCSSSTIEVSSKNKNSNNSDHKSLGKPQPSASSLIRQIEKENPGLTEGQGWLNLFIKDHEVKRKGSVMSKKKRTLFNKEDNEFNPTSLKELLLENIEAIQHLDIYSADLNLLTVEDCHLQAFTKKVFNQLSFFNRKELNRDYFDNFLIDLHKGYQIYSNPFHNFTHGVNVMHTCFLISNIEKNDSILTPLKKFSTVLSGLCHDVGHTGRTNSFEIASGSKKALVYNDLSPLQSYHASTTFQIMRKTENNFLQKFSLQEQKEIRADIISNILYTDIKEHFPLIKKFKETELDPKEGKVLENSQLLILTGMITHTSDFGGSAKEFEVCREWSRRVNIEFMAQYKQEAELGLPQTPFFKDLDVEHIMAKNEMGFLKVIVFPLYETLDHFYGEESCLRKLRQYAEDNIKNWDEVFQKASKSAKKIE